jgi:hypothetical protein
VTGGIDRTLLAVESMVLGFKVKEGVSEVKNVFRVRVFG